ncbi:thiamine biosynthesis protein ThiF [Georgenia yuyongxinii]|uniref:Thiamine biosynthesis protein ThiF n=1 Tax=Georgenia yuyongxinii TaxID=2589797 RepID=A0A5B8C4D8_9MICO|nr:ThiF family adenylyltransferase [Georgenia yuyongxinii]QDC25433.1 thiamine biosynthesis protein ThiF [Georgenia yuyongxinii]
MHLRPGLSVLWRGPGESQVGVDPRCAVVLDGLTPGDQRVVEHLTRGPTPADLQRVGRAVGVEPERVRELVARLKAAGVLDTRPTRSSWSLAVPDTEESYWSRLRDDGDGAAVLAVRASKRVAVVGLDRVGSFLATFLAMGGVGTLLLDDVSAVTEADLGVFQARDVGGRRATRAVTHLRAAFPRLRTSAPAGTRPDLVVTVSTAVADPLRLRHLRRAAIAHLPVVVGEVAVVVGPLVVPGRGPCTRCLDLHRVDADPAWPALAAQLLTSAPTGTPATLAQLGAALAAHQVLAALDDRTVTVTGATLEVTALDPVPLVRQWAPHPACGCDAPSAPATDPAAATTTPDQAAATTAATTDPAAVGPTSADGEEDGDGEPARADALAPAGSGGRA